MPYSIGKRNCLSLVAYEDEVNAITYVLLLLETIKPALIKARIKDEQAPYTPINPRLKCLITALDIAS